MPRVPTRSSEWLLALLVLRHGRAVDRSWLAGTLWPDSTEGQALRNLRDILMHLRKALGPERDRVQSPTRDTLTLDLTGADIDTLQFDAAMQAGDEEALRRAVDLYTGPLLEGCFEEWVVLERNQRQQACLRALETLANAAEQRQDYVRALEWLRRAEGMDALSDSIRRGLMRVLAASGDAPAALSAYRDYRIFLREEMNVEPDAETAGLYQQIRQQARQAAQHREAIRPEALPASAPPPETPFSPAALPHPLTTLIGRERETREIVETLSQSRLVTLRGGGGVGKTRLSIEVARNLASHFAQEVAFVELASLAEAALLPAFVASALELREEATPEQALIGCLATREMLLVLDNCEHLIDAAAALAQTLLERCPRLRILATSRQRLGLTGEVAWRVPSLLVPDVERLPSSPADATAAALTFPAIQLFVERASSAHTGFRLSRRDEVEAACRICYRLDGIPLAIELAAVRVRSLTVENIHSRLDQRFRFLTGGSRSALPRQQTLQSLIDWSYDLLSEEEKALFCRLAVFSSGWTLEAAESVCAGDAVEEWEILDLLTSLIDKSLVMTETSGVSVRYRLLETVRQYARDRLAERGEELTIRTRHQACFLMLAEESRPKLRGSEQAHWLSVLEEEHDNLRAALTFCLRQPGNGEAGLQLGGALWPFWMMRGHLSEGRDHLTALLSSPEAQTRSKVRAAALHGAGALAKTQGDYAAAQAYHERSLEIFRELGDKIGVADSLNGLGNVAHDLGDFAAARTQHEESLAIQRELGNRRGIGVSLVNLGRLACQQGDYAVARTLFEESLTIQRELEDKGGTANSLYTLGLAAFYQEDYTQARSLFEESLEIRRELAHRQGIGECLNVLALIAHALNDDAEARVLNEESLTIQRELGNRWGIAASLLNLGTVSSAQGDDVSACAMYKESLTILSELGDRSGIAELLEAFAELAHKEAFHDRAIQLWSAASALREAIHYPQRPTRLEEIERWMAAARSALGEEEFAVARDRGRAMTLEQAIEYALR
jgi:predicted ATPase/DNA-binding SARP family transcriptional activator